MRIYNEHHQQQDEIYHEAGNSIILLNNHGVFCLEHGEIGPAMTHLLEAFRKAKELFQAVEGRLRTLDDRHDTGSSFDLLNYLFLISRQPGPRPPEAARRRDEQDPITAAGATDRSSSCPETAEERAPVINEAIRTDGCSSVTFPQGGTTTRTTASAASPDSAAATTTTTTSSNLDDPYRRCCFLYRQALHLPNIPPELIVSACSMKVALLSVVLLNLALLHQYAAGEEEEGEEESVLGSSSSTTCCEPRFSREVWLGKAAKLYELAFQLQHEERPMEQSLLFQMVVLNNLGQIYQKLGQKTGADSCFTRLLSMIMYLVDQRDPSSFSALGNAATTGSTATTTSNGSTSASMASGSSGDTTLSSNEQYVDQGRDLLEGFMMTTSHLILKGVGVFAPAA